MGINEPISRDLESIARDLNLPDTDLRKIMSDIEKSRYQSSPEGTKEGKVSKFKSKVVERLGDVTDNLFSKRYLGYQILGGAAGIGSKILLPAAGVFDDGGYMDNLYLQFSSGGSAIAIQTILYPILESKRYGQSYWGAFRELYTLRAPELITSVGASFLNAGQATGVGAGLSTTLNFNDLFSKIAGAVSTSIPFANAGGWLTSGPGALAHATYRRLQLRKEQGVFSDEIGVYTNLIHEIKQGLSESVRSLASTMERHTPQIIKLGFRDYAVRPAVAMLTTMSSMIR